jgi:hypothetical protein
MAPGGGRDPLIYARFLRCGTCLQVRFPVDAQWLEPGLILAAFPGSCPHVSPVTVIIDVPEMIAATADIDPAKYLPGRRCAGITSRGRRCRAFAVPGCDFCAAHPAQAERRPR